jgi:hypothetical protein
MFSSPIKTGCAKLETATYTVALWLSAATTTHYSVIAKPYMAGTGAAHDSWQLMSDTDFNYSTYANNVDQDLRASGAVAPTTWQHVAFTFDGTTKVLYVDGLVKASTIAIPAPTDTSSAVIGCDVDMAPTMFFAGAIDDVMVFDRVLSPSEIAALATP